MKVAVVRNRKNTGIISELGLSSPERYGRRSVQSVMDALREIGHTVKVMEGDTTIFRQLKKFMPPDAESQRPTGMVFNMSYGIQGEARYSHVPHMLEMVGVPYTGAGPYGHAISLDKVLSKTVIVHADVPTPQYCTLADGSLGLNGLRYPLVVKPRHESTSNGLELVSNHDELASAVDAVIRVYRQEALVEEYIDGREIAVCMLGNDPVEILPLVELDFGGRPLRIVTRPDKFHKSEDEPAKICPAPLSMKKDAELRAIALAVFRICQCRDCARVDLRLDAQDRPYVLEINSMPALGAGGAYVLSARVAGYSFEDLIGRIVDVAHQRYYGSPAPRDVAPADATPLLAPEPPSTGGDAPEQDDTPPWVCRSSHHSGGGA